MKWGVLTLIVCLPSFSSANDLTKALAELLFQNECGSKQANLVYWSKNEPFPSMGIGHFIWFPKSLHDQPFEETFPQLFQFLRQKSQKIPKSPVPPAWLTKLKPFELPWVDRRAFLAQVNTPDVRSLRQYLWRTRHWQAEFVMQRFQQKWQQTVQTLPLAQRERIQQTLERLMQTPRGSLMVLDYSNFKGLGNNSKEQYQGKGWGLIEVLNQMAHPSPALSASDLQAEFIQAAKTILRQRVKNAPKLTNGKSSEQHWLAGWFRRLDRLAQLK